MSGDDLRVTAEHLGDLAVRQERAAAETRNATRPVEGVDAAVRSTHGNIAAATSGALDAVLQARLSAGNRMAGVSDALRDKLTQATTRYGHVDDAMSAKLGRQVDRA